MSRRTQVTLGDEHYELLKRESDRTGLSLAELVRRAVASTYRRRDRQEFEDALDAAFGLWKDREFDSVEYVKRLRGPGLGYRLARDDRS